MPLPTGRRSDHPPRRRARPALATALLLAALGGCSDDPTAPGEPGELAGSAFVVNSIGETVSRVGLDAEGRLVAQNDVVELGAASVPVTMAVGSGVLVVPAGGTNRVLVLEAETLAERCAAVLPVGSSPGGVTVAGDHAFVSLLLHGAVARIALSDCEVEATAPVGPAPVDVEVVGDELFVVLGNIDLLSGAFPPPQLGESFVAVLDRSTLEVRDSIPTGGSNAQFLAPDGDGELVVVNSGDFGAGNSTLAVLDPVARRLEAGPFPIGDFGGELAVAPDGRVYVSSFSHGLYVFDSRADVVLRDATNPLTAPDASGEPRGASGVDVDERGNVLSVFFGDGATPGQVFLFDASEALVDSVTVGLGPFPVRFEEAARPG